MLATASPAAPPTLLAVTDIQGSPRQLSDYRGKVLIVVNVASKCGFTGARHALSRLPGRRAVRLGRGLSVAPGMEGACQLRAILDDALAAACLAAARSVHQSRPHSNLQSSPAPSPQATTTRACSSCTASIRSRGLRC